MADLFVNVGHLIPIAGSDLNADDKTPAYRPGGMSFVQDGFGFRIFQYCRNNSGGATLQGEIQRRVAKLVVTDITSGTTTSATKVGAFTADKHNGMIMHVFDNSDSAGAAPEGEISPIAGSTADTITLDRALSVALAVNDDIDIFGTWQVEDTVAGDNAVEVVGCCVGADGTTNGQYGWWQIYGLCPDVRHTSAAFVHGAVVVAGAAVVAVVGAATVEDWLGYQFGEVKADETSDRSAVVFQLFGFLRPVT